MALKSDELYAVLEKKIEEGGGGSGGTNNYNDLSNKPRINDVELYGNKSLQELGFVDYSDDIDSLNSSVENAESEISQVKSDLESLETNVRDIDDSLADTQSDISNLQQNEIAIDARLSNIENKKDIEEIEDATTTLVLSNSKRGLINITSIKGMMEQEKTTGKNLCDPRTFASGLLGTTDGIVYGTSQWITSDYIEVSDNVTISGYKDGLDANFCVRFCEYDENKIFINGANNISVVDVAKYVKTINLNSSTKYIRFTVGFDNKPTTTETFFQTNRIQIELGSQVTDYEPYTGGIASPNPDYPQSIKKVTVDKVKVTGFNQWDEEWEVGGINVSTGKNIENRYNIRSKNYISVLPGMTIFYHNGSGQSIRPFYYDSNYNFIETVGLKVSDSATTTPNNAYYMRFVIVNEYGTTYKNDICINVYDTEKNGSYEPYQSKTIQLSEPIDLYGNDEVRDEIIRRDDNELNVLRKYGVAVFDGNEDEGWVSDPATGSYAIINFNRAKNGGFLMCDQLKYPIDTAVNEIGIGNNLNVYAEFESLADWKSHLQSNHMTLVYELATSTTELLSAADQIALNSIPTYDTVTYLELVDTEVEPDVRGEYGVSTIGGYTLEAKLTAKNAQLVNSYGVLVYGMHIDGNESDPTSMITYLADAEGMTPVHMDYTNDKFDYGSWGDTFILNEKPCVLNSDGTVYAYLNKDDFTKDVYGNDVTAIVDGTTDFGQNVMIEFPKIYMKIVPDTDDSKSASVYFSPIKLDSDYKDYAYIDKNGNHKEHFYMPSFNGSIVNNGAVDVMRSILGKTASNNLNAQQEINACVANGIGWYTEDAGEVMLINMILLLIGKSTDTQTVFGQGLNTGGSDGFTTGVHATKGMFYGTNSGTASTYTNAVKVFGIENWWGFRWRRYAGDINDKGTRKIKLCYGREDGSTTDSFNLDGTGYVDVGATPSGTDGGYISDMKFTESGMYSKISSGSSSTYYTDGQWFYNGQVNYALRGGGSNVGSRVGALCVSLYAAAADASRNVGAALSCK